MITQVTSDCIWNLQLEKKNQFHSARLINSYDQDLIFS